jgi:NADH-quinone oxidoreductase subunit J
VIISLSFFIQNPVWVLLYILTGFLILGILLINTGIEFITFFFIIVYLGALMMLFLFVIMLFDLQQLSFIEINKQIKIIKGFIVIYLFIFLYNIELLIIQNLENINFIPIFETYNKTKINFNTLQFFNFYYLDNTIIFKTLYIQNKIFFIIITLILLYTLIGALIIIALIMPTNRQLKNNQIKQTNKTLI